MILKIKPTKVVKARFQVKNKQIGSLKGGGDQRSEKRVSDMREKVKHGSKDEKKEDAHAKQCVAAKHSFSGTHLLPWP